MKIFNRSSNIFENQKNSGFILISLIPLIPILLFLFSIGFDMTRRQLGRHTLFLACLEASLNQPNSQRELEFLRLIGIDYKIYLISTNASPDKSRIRESLNSLERVSSEGSPFQNQKSDFQPNVESDSANAGVVKSVYRLHMSLHQSYLRSSISQEYVCGIFQNGFFVYKIDLNNADKLQLKPFWPSL